MNDKEKRSNKEKNNGKMIFFDIMIIVMDDSSSSIRVAPYSLTMSLHAPLLSTVAVKKRRRAPLKMARMLPAC
jgi:hypothetical protein